jgi:penicillin G amidase
MRNRIFKILAGVVALILVVAVGLGLYVRGQLRGSLPQLEGRVLVPELGKPVTIERDSLGIPTIRGESRIDVAFATGFVHAQDRFFQMDLLRRNSAGELAEIVGPAVRDADHRVRLNRFRDCAQKVLASGTTDERNILEAYSNGVNAGLKALRTKPFEYLLLGVEPEPWKPEDCALVMFSMYLDLQGDQYSKETRLGLLHEVMPEPMFDFLAPRGTEWDAPIQGEAFAVAAIPGPDVFDTRQDGRIIKDLLAAPGWMPKTVNFHPGSNNWAVAGKHTRDGRALLANDMHLSIRVPHVWYRASIVWPAEGEGQPEQRMTGVSLPGTPSIVVGSNGHVAWGFTNTEGDWADVVMIDRDPADKDSYLTPDGPRKFEHHAETIKVKGQPDETLDVVTTIWGPIVDHDAKDRPRAIRWVAHDVDGVNMGLMRLESARTLEEALDVANLSGSPHQNFVVADDKGRIAWTVLGRIPKRVGFEGRMPTSWADGSHKWEGYLKPEEYPRVIDPEGGRIWTANGRVVSDEMLAKMGDGGYDLGARAQQIRDDLVTTEKATEADMLRIQLDDRAVFLERWRQLLLDTLTPEAAASNRRRGDLRKLVENWGGHAKTDSVGFRAVREFRHRLLAQLSDVLVNPCKKIDAKFMIADLDRTEGPVWRLVSEKPEHLLDPRYKSWNELLLTTADQVLTDSDRNGSTLNDYTWGKYNTTRIKHPLSLAVPSLSRWLDMPQQQLAGDSENIPRIQAPAMGASERLGVSPGHEADGYLHMPCGQSGHPLSPHYGDSHAAWCDGEPTPFLPGEAMHKLVLQPVQ